MQPIIEIYDNHREAGIQNRKITEGDEICLVRKFINYRKSTFAPTMDKKLAIFIEAKVGNAYPDILFVEYNPQNYNRWNKCRNDLMDQEFKVLYYLYEKQGSELADIVTKLGMTWKLAALSVEKLFDSELIERKNKKWVVKDVEAISANKIEAVEAKLNKWEQVFQQSIVNKNFATESYALSLARPEPKKDVLNKFRKFGIGIYLEKGNDFTLLKKAKSINKPVSYNSIIINEWVGRILNSGGR